MAMARPDLLEKLRPYGSGMLPITGLAAATASLKVKTLIAERRKINAGGQSCPQPAFSRLDPLESGSAAKIGCPTSDLSTISWDSALGSTDGKNMGAQRKRHRVMLHGPCQGEQPVPPIGVRPTLGKSSL